MITAVSELFKYYSSFVDTELLKAYVVGSRSVARDPMTHIEAAVQWICRAQDAFEGGGVARSYSMIYQPYFKRRGWFAPYPETTGYIIPTLIDYARMVSSQELIDRALRMADWECRVQMPSGAVQGGMIDQASSPAIFNTGQVIFGWIRAFKETGTQKYLDSAIRAGEFLVLEQDTDGAWRKSLSNFTDGTSMTSYTYNTRTAWALLELAMVTGSEAFKGAAVRNVEYALGEQTENGWFRSNCLTQPEHPLTHTIAYCIRGIMEIGSLLKNESFLASAGMAADAVLARQRPDGSLAGRYNRHWEPAVSWRCLTGEAQMAGIWGRLYQLTGRPGYLEGMRKANAGLRRVQFMRTDQPGLYGGISGSAPIHGMYGRFEILNWAVKFFLDAQMLELSLMKKGDSRLESNDIGGFASVN
ncbi:MAG: hypothetical protein CAF45_016180 [Nitrospira sp. CG24E]|nr:MAG: hypothetical protein CAF45_016180 [Nitrospira sp. CG24E]